MEGTPQIPIVDTSQQQDSNNNINTVHLPPPINTHNYWLRRKKFVPESNVRDQEITTTEKEFSEEIGREVQQLYENIVFHSSPPRKRRRDTPIEDNHSSLNNNNNKNNIQQEQKNDKRDYSDNTTSPSSDSLYCDICLEYYTEPLSTHLRSVPHQLSVNSQSATFPSKTYYLNESNKGYQMLKGGQFGEWSEEVGLGANNQGRLDPVKTVLKTDRKGLSIRTPQPRVTHYPRGQNPKLIERGIITDDSTSKKTKRRIARQVKKIKQKREKQQDEKIRNELYREPKLVELLNNI